jgi:hypothetical protein
MTYDQAPEKPITPGQAVTLVQAFIDERGASGVPMAGAFTDLELVEGVLTATWSEAAIGKAKSEVLLELSPFENLAEWLSTPMSFDNEEGRQIRQHVHTVSVIGPFGVGSMSARELHKRGAGL